MRKYESAGIIRENGYWDKDGYHQGDPPEHLQSKEAPESGQGYDRKDDTND